MSRMSWTSSVTSRVRSALDDLQSEKVTVRKVRYRKDHKLGLLPARHVPARHVVSRYVSLAESS